jgi:hypothetical protein
MSDFLSMRHNSQKGTSAEESERFVHQNGPSSVDDANYSKEMRKIAPTRSFSQMKGPLLDTELYRHLKAGAVEGRKYTTDDNAGFYTCEKASSQKYKTRRRALRDSKPPRRIIQAMSFHLWEIATQAVYMYNTFIIERSSKISQNAFSFIS